jgi:hypothetical protein
LFEDYPTEISLSQHYIPGTTTGQGNHTEFGNLMVLNSQAWKCRKRLVLKMKPAENAVARKLGIVFMHRQSPML